MYKQRVFRVSREAHVGAVSIHDTVVRCYPHCAKVASKMEMANDIIRTCHRKTI
jgi:phosphopantothenate synthetase